MVPSFLERKRWHVVIALLKDKNETLQWSCTDKRINQQYNINKFLMHNIERKRRRLMQLAHLGQLSGYTPINITCKTCK